MKNINNRKKLIAYLFAYSLLVASIFPLNADLFANNPNFSVKEDSTKVESAAKLEKSNSKKGKVISVESKSTSELSYNFVYFLISKIVQAITITRPR